MRIAGSILALSMLASTPASVFAETYKKDDQIFTTDWSDEFRKSEEAETGNWALSKKNRLVRVSPADPVKTPDINYIGVYTNTDGREVVRFSFNAFTAAANQWDKLLLKLPKVFDDMVDHNHPFNGIYKKTPGYGTHDEADRYWEGHPYSEAKATPEALAWNIAGSQNVYSFDLYKNGSMTKNSRLNLPIDFVLKEGQSIKNLKTDALVQARLTDKNYERVYARAGEITNDYMQYTMTTIIPKDKNFGIDVNTDLSNVGPTNPAATYNKFFSTVSSVKFNIEKGYLEVYHRQNKWATGSGYALRQSVGSDFYDLLDVRNGMVGEVYLMDAGAKPYSPPKGQPYEPSTKIQFARSDINENLGKGIGFLQVAGGDWDTTHEYEGGIKTKKSPNVSDTDAVLNSTTAQFNGGVYTVVRYFIKPDQLKKLIKENGLKSYTFRTSIVRPNESKYTTGNTVKGISQYTFTADKERNLKRGDKVKLKFDKAQYNRVAATYTTLVEIIVGDDNYNIPFRNTTSYDRDGLEATWDVPFDIKIKKGEKITVKSLDYDENNRATKLAMYFGDNDFQEAKPKVNYNPIEMLKSDSITGGALTSTIEKPNVNEIFTDDQAITGHSIHEGAEINITFPGIKPEVKKQTLTAVGPDTQKDDFDYTTIMTPAKKVHTENFLAFPFDTSKPNSAGYIQGDKKYDEFKMPDLVKDMRVEVDNLAGLSSFIPSDSVDEKVQAKVKFDLNGGSLDKSIVSFEGYDKDIKSKELYKVARQDEKAPVTRIVPMNKKYADEEGYKVNGFVGEDASDLDHDGFKLEGNDKTLREFVKEAPTKTGYKFLGWTTKKIEGSPEVASNEFAKLQEATTTADLRSNDNYIFTENTPVDKTTTVYAVYGAPGIRLHSNFDADPAKEGLQEYVDNQILDKNVVDKINKGDDLSKVEVELKKVYDKQEFKRDGYSLVGFSRNKDADEPDVNVTGDGLTKDLYLRDGGKFKLEDSGKITKKNGEENYKYTFDKDKGLDLYAVWKKNFTVKASKKWADKAGVEQAENADNTKDLKFALIGRPAVGTFGHEVIADGATYYPIQGTIKDYNPNGMTWDNMPGYDAQGRRMSYIIVELKTQNQINAFKNGSTNWQEYGIKIEEKLNDPQTGEVIHWGRKTQYIELGSNPDAFSSATVRKHTSADHPQGVAPHGEEQAKLGYFDSTGYIIDVANTIFDVLPPTIHQAYVGENEVKVQPPQRRLSQLEIETPDGKKLVLVPDPKQDVNEKPVKYIKDSTQSTSDMPFEMDGEGNVILKPTTPLKAGDKYKATSVIQAGDKTAKESSEMTVKDRLGSNKVEKIRQGKLTDDGQVPVIFEVPQPSVLNKPTAGTVYTVFTKDPNTGELKDTGKTYTIPAEGAERIPGTEQTINVPKADLEGKEIVIRAHEPNKTETDSDPFKPDLQGPEATGSAINERWRRWANLEASFDEDIEGEVVISYDKDGNSYEVTTDSKGLAQVTVQELGFDKTVTNIKVKATDKFGNVRETTVGFDYVDVTDMDVVRLLKGRNFVIAKPHEENTTLTVNVYAEGTDLNRYPRDRYFQLMGDDKPEALATATVPTSAIKNYKLYLTDANGAPYKLKQGDIVYVVATIGTPGQDGYKISNPKAYRVE